MRAVCVDTNAYVAFKRGDEKVIAVLQHAPTILLSVTVLGELLAGFAAGNRESVNRSELTRFLDSSRVRLAVSTSTTADLYALVYAALRRKGQPIPSNDLWIAATCLEHGSALLTLDAHFQNIDGLRVGRQLEDFIP
ncbi:MAG: type II toxin-antitoxin system VapC family toxin [Comamonadaceae bacterium]|jgi:predicted nucleic acid-binding protein|nr:MAG: type II toxin-antitoxin system VapC family toxin [Comamonadaceae bacterium]